ncbi:MAG: hypothetical protein V4537_00615 [Pseudomonadota bacterium]
MLALLLAVAIAQADPAQPDPTTPRDWGLVLRRDAAAFHDLIADDHPGPYNRLDPGFAARNDAAFRLAQSRAGKVHDFAGYLWAMRGYVASFDDGHVQFSTVKGSPLLTARWPGFLTGLDGRGRAIVMTRADDAAVPLGAELIACDGVPAVRMAARNVGAFSGRWQLSSQRTARSGRLFLDTGNPFIVRPSRCRFRVRGAIREVALAWRPLVDPEWARRIGETAPMAKPEIGARILADGTRWFSMSSFDGDPDGATAKALRPMIAAMRRDRAAIGAAPRIVLDLRGNGGGSSLWSSEIADVLWGRAAVAALPEDRSYVEWRASAGNLRRVEAYRDDWAKAQDASPQALAWARAATAGLAAARAAGRPLWREPDEPRAAPDPASAIPPSKAGVYVLTDWGCGSACLDAVDLWTALGAVPIGQETSADTLYMEVGDVPLPSGIATVGIPMKVYRGRPRGSNVPVRPRHRYLGDMRDTPALERWIATLPR